MAQYLIDDDALQSFLTLWMVLRRVLQQGPVTIKTLELSGSLGLTLFASRVVLMDPRQSDREWRCTLLHELIHLARGPVAPEDAAQEEDIVNHLASLLLMPDAEVLARSSWTQEQMRELAEARLVDLDTVEAALNPPTMPVKALVRPAFIPVDALAPTAKSQEIAQGDVALAARPEPALR